MDAAPRFDATAMTRLPRVSAVVPSPCGTWLAVAVSRLNADESRYVSDLWRVSLEGAAPVQLTRGDSKDGSPRFRRDGSLGFLSNRNPREAAAEDGDDTRSQVWILPADGGEPRPLTDEPLGVGDFRFASAGDRLIVIADVLPGVPHAEQRTRAAEIAKKGPSGLRYTRMPIRHWDHWRPVAAPHVIAYDERGGDRRDLTPNAMDEHRPTEWDTSFDVSPDGARVVVIAGTPSADRLADVALRVIEVATGAHRDLGAASRVDHREPRWSPDGTRIACTVEQRLDGRIDRPTLHVYDVAAGTSRPVAADWDVWPTPAAWTPDGAALLCTADYRGHVPVFRVEVASGEVTRITAESAGGSHGNLTVLADGTTVVGVRSRIHHPPEPFRVRLAGECAPELVACLSGFREQDGAAIGRWESITVPGDGGTPIQSFVLVPAGVDAAHPAPGLVWIHGGPIGMAADGWHWRWNPLVPAAAGYVVAMPNPRGSTGFGQELIQGIWNNEWGGACYRDLMAVTDALEQRPEIDAARIGAMGGSFGGYMANWIGVSTDRFRCLVTHAGLYWLSSFYGTTDYPAFCSLEAGLSPYDDLGAYDRYSPHTRLDQWKTPTLIIHGEKDYRVPISEALMLFEGLQLRGIDSELLVYPDENHWILQPRNTRQWYEEVLRFAAKHLSDCPPST
ncbi:MAG TPA: S9 family peptidase [Kofleriaceae bacterium]|nr:S9 family peptidase [Kofleriaceae bacterium]